MSLHFVLHENFDRVVRPAPPSGVAVRVQVASAPQAAPEASLPTIMPLRTNVTSVRKSTPKAVAKKAVPLKNAQATEFVAQQFPPLATISQPALVNSPVLANPLDLPTIASSGRPPLPGDYTPNEQSLVFSEKPGGEVVVLAVLLNEQGLATDTRIVVPSRYPLGDITFALANQNKLWRDLDPPLMPGEQRWLELRLDHSNKPRVQDLIP